MKPKGIDLIIMGSRTLVGIEKLEAAIVTMKEDAPPIIIHSGYTNAESQYRGTPLQPYIMKYVVKSSSSAPLLEAVREVIGNP